MSSVWGNNTDFFYKLTPDIIEDSIQSIGLKTTGRVIALNSLENRVYQIELDSPLDELPSHFSKNHIIVKFYRPGRWNKESIQEEHLFSQTLANYEIPVIKPLSFERHTLFIEEKSQLYYAIFPKVYGRLKDELNDNEVSKIGRTIAQLHNIGSLESFKHRPIFGPKNYLESHLDIFRNIENISQSLISSYIQLAQQINEMITPHFSHLEIQRIHGDFHRGNILWTDEGPHIVDLDDCSMGPVQQDLWLLIPGRDSESRLQQKIFIESYNQMSHNPIRLSTFITEALRTIRMIHFNGWIARRWEDPTFKNTYTEFDSEVYWQTQLLDLKEQIGLLQDALFQGH